MQAGGTMRIRTRGGHHHRYHRLDLGLGLGRCPRGMRRGMGPRMTQQRPGEGRLLCAVVPVVLGIILLLGAALGALVVEVIGAKEAIEVMAATHTSTGIRTSSWQTAIAMVVVVAVAIATMMGQLIIGAVEGEEERVITLPTRTILLLQALGLGHTLRPRAKVLVEAQVQEGGQRVIVARLQNECPLRPAVQLQQQQPPQLAKAT
jgi:hypothetical protein